MDPSRCSLGTYYAASFGPCITLLASQLNLVWVVPHFARIAKRDVSWAWRVGGLFLPMSFVCLRGVAPVPSPFPTLFTLQGWSAGDVSLAAYIQAAVQDKDFGESFHLERHKEDYNSYFRNEQGFRSWRRYGLSYLISHFLL